MNKPKKLLEERLRSGEFSLPDNIHFTESAFAYFCEKIADEIEEYYVPLPRFEDGTVVERGRITEKGVVCEVIVRNDGYYTLYDTQSKVLASGPIDKLVKCPTYKIFYDADGVEIKAGDIVYDLENDGKRGHVAFIYPFGAQVNWDDGSFSFDINSKSITHKEPVFDADGVECKVGDTVWNLNDGNKYRIYKINNDNSVDIGSVGGSDYLAGYQATNLTHKEPDSLEKLRDDIYSVILDDQYHECIDAQLVDWTDRISDMIERNKKYGNRS